jgi:hypothetical protein
MPDAEKHDAQMARAIAQVLESENISLEDLKRKVPRGFWEKVRQVMGPDGPDSAVLRQNWKRKASRQAISALVEFSRSDLGREIWGPVTCEEGDSLQLEDYPDLSLEQTVDVDTSMLVSLDADDLISLGVLSDAVDGFDNSDITSTESLDIYSRDDMTLMETIDLETETWPDAATMSQVEDTQAVVEQMEGRLQDRLARVISEMESRLTALVRSAVHKGIRSALDERFSSSGQTENEECPEPSGKAAGQTMELMVNIDKSLFDLFQTESKAAYDGDASKTMNAVLWRYYGKPKLSFERQRNRGSRNKPKE